MDSIDSTVPDSTPAATPPEASNLPDVPQVHPEGSSPPEGLPLPPPPPSHEEAQKLLGRQGESAILPILRSGGIDIRIKKPHIRPTAEGIERKMLLAKFFRPYPLNMLSETGEINWDSWQVFSLYPHEVRFWVVKFLHRGPTTIKQLRVDVVKECEQRGVPYTEAEFQACLKGWARNHEDWAILGLGTLKGEGDKIWIDYQSALGLVAYNRLKHRPKPEVVKEKKKVTVPKLRTAEPAVPSTPLPDVVTIKNDDTGCIVIPPNLSGTN
jgi:hypothetical protein